ncbi:MAG: ADP compounds hydrolase NudE [Gammaproteobacteria bacterium]|nr:MAG: ADP compounds hydrolase NudE [Gammaproteobacteria bacterium]
MKQKPRIIKTQTLSESRLFSIEQVSLEFSNGSNCDYERIIASSNGAVLIVPVLDESTVIMIREYSVGTERYELVFPKGRMDDGENILQAANRELMEETGYGANLLAHIHTMSIAPGYLGFDTYIVVAENLYEHKLDGDEPEPLEVVHCALNDFQGLINHPELTEARSIAALYMVRDILHSRQVHD